MGYCGGQSLCMVLQCAFTCTSSFLSQSKDQNHHMSEWGVSQSAFDLWWTCSLPAFMPTAYWDWLHPLPPPPIAEWVCTHTSLSLQMCATINDSINGLWWCVLLRLAALCAALSLNSCHNLLGHTAHSFFNCRCKSENMCVNVLNMYCVHVCHGVLENGMRFQSCQTAGHWN